MGSSSAQRFQCSPDVCDGEYPSVGRFSADNRSGSTADLSIRGLTNRIQQGQSFISQAE
jgi:hypothetical protein